MIRRLRLRVVGGLVLLPALVSACAADAPLDTLDPQGPEARSIDNLLDPVLIVAGVVFVAVQAGILYLAWRFRRRDGDDELPAQIHGNTKLEIGWTVLPAVILAGVAVFTVVTLLSMSDTPDTDVKIEVVGQQWWWEYRYDVNGDGDFDDIVTAQDLVIPAGKYVDLTITSRDVIHSFWIPKLNGKRDAVPGRAHPLALYADDPGIYWGQCTEYCWLSHPYMQMRVVALDDAEYDAWIENQMEPAEEPESGSLAAEGLEIFRAQCTSCHLVTGNNDDIYDPDAVPLLAGAAPNLTHFATRGTFAGAIFDLWQDLDGNGEVDHDEVGEDGTLNRARLKAWLRNPPAEKPMAPENGQGMPDLGLTEEQIDALVAYLETLD
jgi:cytochrome c oxidase subunit II